MLPRPSGFGLGTLGEQVTARMLMMSPSLLKQAKEGDATAIATLLTHALKPKGIVVRGDRQSYCLRLWFSSCPAPPQPATVAYVRRTMEKLQPPNIGIVQLYGEQTGAIEAAWSEEISLLSAVPESDLSSRQDSAEIEIALRMSSVPRSLSHRIKPQSDRLALADDTDLLSFQNRYSNGLIFPGLMLMGMLMNAMPIVNALLFGIKIWLHEFGHATVAWLAGRQALPLPIGWTTISTQRSLLVYIGILTLLGLLFWAGRREGKRLPMVLAVTLMVVQFVMTWLLPEDTFDMLFSFGGIGGEIYLSALLIVGFYFPLPEYFRWDFYRFPVVLGAAFCFWGQVWLWQQVPRGKASIPFGSMWGDAEHGDMNQLVNYHGWTPGDIIGTYSAIAHLCLFAIVAVYGYTLFRQHRETFIALGRQWFP